MSRTVQGGPKGKSVSSKRQGGARGRPVSAGPTASVAEAQAKVSPARAAAFEILMLVGEGKGHSDELLCGPGFGAQAGARTAGLSTEDRNLTTALVMGVLRWQIALDAEVGRLLARPGQRLAEPVALALRLGAFQLRHMDRIPAHAALSESVELCRAAGEPHAAGMVNAVLRKIAASTPTSQKREVGHPVRGESTAAMAERLGHPLWLVERWVAAYGRAAAEAICTYGQREPERGGLFAGSEGAIEIDDGSRLVAEIAAAAAPAVDGRPLRVWDCCAAPGGKTLVLAGRLRGAEILATDVSARRLRQMEARLRGHAEAAVVRCVVEDVADPPRSQNRDLGHPAGTGVAGEFDLILCDVPCSGTGTLGRNPEIRLRLRPEELERQGRGNGRF